MSSVSARAARSSWRAGRVRGAPSIAAVCALVGCAEVLGIPSDPELVGAPALAREETASNAEAMSPPVALALDAAAAPTPTSGAAGAPGSDGIVPAGNIAGIEEMTQPGLAAGQPMAAPTAVVDAGVGDADSGVPPAVGCEGIERVPVDVVFIVDNSGSMVGEVAVFEQALPAFVERLESDEVDFRIILLSRHRVDEPGASAEASTSVCIPAPVSGLAACPAPRPVPGPRFFPYSVKIDATDSLQRALESFSRPDPFGLTEIGWSEWLRAESLAVFIEISDADSDLPLSVFTSGLSAAAPEIFGVTPAAPNFVFHSVVGVLQKALAFDIYIPDEPIEPRVCDGEGSNPDNAGEEYQQLSRLTGGLRLSICPAGVLGVRLQALATDVAQRSVQLCAAAGLRVPVRAELRSGAAIESREPRH